MDKKIAVLGTGAIGGSIGADLTKAGHDVTLIDQWPAHVEAMKARGLRFIMIRTGEDFRVPVRAIHLCELASLKTQFDIVFLASKAYDSIWLAQLIEPYLKSDGVLVSTQNSMTDEWTSPIIGAERGIGSAVELSAQVFEPGLIRRNTDQTSTQFSIGELSGKLTPRVQEIAQIMSAVGKIEITTNVWGAKWSKLIQSTASLTIMPIVGVSGRELLDDPDFFDFSIKIGAETVRVGEASGYVVEPIFGLTKEDFECSVEEKAKKVLVKIMGDLGKSGTNEVGEMFSNKLISELSKEGTERWLSCILQDLLKGRLTETNVLNGLVVRKGQKVNVPAPINQAVNVMMREIEQGKRRMMDRSNFEILKKCL